MEFIPTGAMDIPLSQQAIIYNGELFNQELNEVTKLIYQWIFLIVKIGVKSKQLIKMEKLLSAIHTDIQKRWSVEDMAVWMQCSEQYLRRLFMKYTGKTPKEYYLDARLG